MKLLFVCTYNRLRSLTAEQIFKNRPGLTVRSAGTASSARVRLKTADIVWADYIFVMEPKHEDIIRHKFARALGDKRIICFNIPDQYQFMDPELIELLEANLKTYLS